MLEEMKDPIPVNYIEPYPVCVCPDLGEENLMKITQAAISTLRAEPQIMSIIEDHNRKRKASHEGGDSDKQSRKS